MTNKNILVTISMMISIVLVYDIATNKQLIPSPIKEISLICMGISIRKLSDY